MNTNTNKKARVKYNFPLVLPAKFTIRELLHSKRGRVEYPTIYQRVKKAEKNGEVKVVGFKTPHQTRRGRKEFIYGRVSAAVTAPVAAS